ncbi:MAG: hypothetical protein Q8R22_10200 [Flavobacterium sp.]|uniref:hypothetical protein n=1 Tax=Flavobacterium sp. TaxID=239 RepID=UPI002736F5BA|nr:hypothetical protein [Flavobacterium sp.]MDP3681190.1 hypothetical protein [Flavobacterium sp.]
MKKNIFIIVLIMLVKPILPVLEYVVNYEYISKVLCINKDKPKMQCNGKCHLMKELAKASDAEKPLSSDKKATSPILDVLIFEEIKSFVIVLVCFGTKEKINPYYSNLYFHLNSTSVFHPPTFIS